MSNQKVIFVVGIILAGLTGADQSAEIIEMEGYLRNWYREASTRDTADDMRDMMQRMMGRSSNARP